MPELPKTSNYIIYPHIFLSRNVHLQNENLKIYLLKRDINIIMNKKEKEGQAMSEKTTMINDLTEGSVSKRLMKFALPFVLANFLQTFYNIVDMIVVGQFCGSVGLSAVSVGGDLMNLFVFISIGFCSAGQVVISQYVGKREYNKVSKTIGTFFLFMMGLAVLFTIVGLTFEKQFLSLMHTPGESYKQAYEYTLVCYIGLIFVYGYNAVAAIMRGMGNSKTPLIFVLVATVVNIIFDYLFVAIFDTGAMGAAIATVMGQGIAFITAIIYLYRKREKFGFDFKLESFIPDTIIMKTLLRLGIPMALQTGAINISIMFVNSFINSYGIVACAVSGVGNKLNSVATIVTQAVATAGSTMVGQNFAAGKLDRVKSIFNNVLLFCMAFVIILSAVIILFPEQVFAVFDNSPDIIEMSHVYMPIAVISFMGFGLRAPCNSLINGQGFALLGFIVGILDSVVARISLSLLFGKVLDMGVFGFWLGTVIAGYVYAIIGGIYYISGKWKTRPLAIK